MSTVIRCADVGERLFDFAVGFSRQPLPKGNRFAIVTKTGGPGIVATDAAIRYGLELALLRPETLETRKAKLPPTANPFNPVDVISDAVHEAYEAAPNTVHAIFDKVRADGRTLLLDTEALAALQAYGFSVLQHGLATTEEEAITLLRKIGSPVALKVASPDVVHKADAGGVLLNISTTDEARAGFQKITNGVKQKLPGVRLLGVEVQPMVARGTEIILGFGKDLAFGHMIMFGLGGTYSEAFRNASFRVIPVRGLGRRNVIRVIGAAKLFAGIRGQQPANTDLIAECFERLSQLLADFPEIAAVDLNPLIVQPSGGGAHVADGHIVLADLASTS
jgi:acyl-CoA synthetase (NDP forming)